MRQKDYVFVGNRFYVLERMLSLGLAVNTIFSQPNTFLERALQERNIPYHPLADRESFIRQLQSEKFDILVSNGCPYILPVSKIKKEHQLFVNVHPSLLPDLRGMHPINGAILFDRQPGATCHIMDDAIDNGAIISQVPLEKTTDLALLYQQSFAAEATVFEKACDRDFKASGHIRNTENLIYYSRKESDLAINWHEPNERIIRRIKAFSIPSQGAYFFYNKHRYTVMDAKITSAPPGHRQWEVASKSDNVLGVFKDSQILQLTIPKDDLDVIRIGDVIR